MITQPHHSIYLPVDEREACGSLLFGELTLDYTPDILVIIRSEVVIWKDSLLLMRDFFRA